MILYLFCYASFHMLIIVSLEINCKDLTSSSFISDHSERYHMETAFLFLEVFRFVGFDKRLLVPCQN